MFWFLMKYVLLGPLLRLFYRLRTSGLENVPAEGPAILATNHLSPLDTVLVPLVVRRKVVFLGKAEYFENRRVAWFFRGAGVIPIRRGGPESREALQGAVEALQEGKLLGIFPEGTRSPDGRMYRGKTGVARIALRARVPVIPIGIVGTYELMPYRSKVPKPGKVDIRFGKPLLFAEHFSKPTNRLLLRSVADEIMFEIRRLSGQDYVDEYASSVKARLGQSETSETNDESPRPEGIAQTKHTLEHDPGNETTRAPASSLEGDA
jgi:1-acyl-sn-glycerol-3-phosphate acyltransferase